MEVTLLAEDEADDVDETLGRSDGKGRCVGFFSIEVTLTLSLFLKDKLEEVEETRGLFSGEGMSNVREKSAEFLTFDFVANTRSKVRNFHACV